MASESFHFTRVIHYGINSEWNAHKHALNTQIKHNSIEDCDVASENCFSHLQHRSSICKWIEPHKRRFKCEHKLWIINKCLHDSPGNRLHNAHYGKWKLISNCTYLQHFPFTLSKEGKKILIAFNRQEFFHFLFTMCNFLGRSCTRVCSRPLRGRFESCGRVLCINFRIILFFEELKLLKFFEAFLNKLGSNLIFKRFQPCFKVTVSLILD